MNKQITAIGGIADDLKATLNSVDITALFDDMQMLRIEGWARWCVMHEQSVREFVQLTPAQRKACPSLKHSKYRRRLTLAALRHLDYGLVLLHQLSSPYLSPAATFRDLAAEAGTAFWHLCAAPVEEWPFSDESPFA